MAAQVPFRVPAIDDQRYRLLTLDNGLKALLVSDSQADKAAAACDVSLALLAWRVGGGPAAAAAAGHPPVPPAGSHQLTPHESATGSLAQGPQHHVHGRLLTAVSSGPAAVQVRVGSLSDDADVAGIAHFTEHMLFYSSEKYPEEDEYRWGGWQAMQGVVAGSDGEGSRMRCTCRTGTGGTGGGVGGGMGGMGGPGTCSTPLLQQREVLGRGGVQVGWAG